MDEEYSSAPDAYSTHKIVHHHIINIKAKAIRQIALNNSKRQSSVTLLILNLTFLPAVMTATFLNMYNRN